jgi:retron-type reverse transcriptase
VWEGIRRSDFIETCKLFRKRIINNNLVYQKKRYITSPKFFPQSYGFRTSKSAHQALQNLKYWQPTITFFIEYDIQNAFDNLNKKRLKSIFCNKITDNRF